MPHHSSSRRASSPRKVYKRFLYKTESSHTESCIDHNEVGSAEAAETSNRAMVRLQNDTEELAVLRAANAALIKRLQEIEGGTPEERDARKWK